MALTPVQNLKFASVKIMQETVDQLEKAGKKPASLTENIINAQQSSSPLKAEEKSTYDKIRTKIAGATVFDSSRTTKEELKAKILRELAKSVGVDIDKGGKDLKDLGRKIKLSLEALKAEDPAKYQEFIDELNKKLGLDKLGLSVEDFVEAIINPDSDKAKKLDEKLDAILSDDKTDGSTSLDEVKQALKKLDESDSSQSIDDQQTAADQQTLASEQTIAEADPKKTGNILTDKETGTYIPKSFPPSLK